MRKSSLCEIAPSVDCHFITMTIAETRSDQCGCAFAASHWQNGRTESTLTSAKGTQGVPSHVCRRSCSVSVLCVWCAVGIEAIKAKVKEARAKPLETHGGKREQEDQVDNINLVKGGNATDYTLRRLARDAPEMLDKIEAELSGTIVTRIPS